MEQHPHPDEDYPAIHLWAEVLGFRHRGIFVPGYRLLLLVGELQGCFKTPTGVFQHTGVQG